MSDVAKVGKKVAALVFNRPDILFVSCRESGSKQSKKSTEELEHDIFLTENVCLPSSDNSEWPIFKQYRGSILWGQTLHSVTISFIFFIFIF